MTGVSMEKLTIGRREIADFPEIHLSGLDVKIDTGAYTSSIHVCECAEESKDGKSQLKVVFLDIGHPQYTGIPIYFEAFKMKKVKSSTGQEQLRYFIRMKILMLGKLIETDFSLTQRNGMKYPILIGRKLLNKRFVVDTALVNVSKKKNRIK